jgi:hypothetical protein
MPFRIITLCSIFFLGLLAACSDGDDGRDGATGPPGITPRERELDKDEFSPGIVVQVLEVTGGSGAGGSFLVGDRLTLSFTVETDDGEPWGLDEFNFARALVSGPSFNYQRVLAEVGDLADLALRNPDGSWTYTFADPIPAAYLAPLLLAS